MTHSLRRARLPLALLLASLLGWMSPETGTAQLRIAQLRIPPAALADNLDSVVQRGQALEQEGRWSEALSFYERALRERPDRRDLKRKLNLAKIHLDVARRYHDPSFLESLRQLQADSSQELFSEVLLKIETHYVLAPQWKQIVERGLWQLEVAIHDPEFKKNNLPLVERAEIESLKQELRAAFDQRRINNRQEAQQSLAHFANFAERRIGLSTRATALEFTCAAISSLDDYSGYLTGSQLDDVFSQIEGNFVGLGIELKADDGALAIVSVIRDGPAYAAGIRQGDRITEVENTPTHSVTMDVAADMLKGPENSGVEIVVQQQGQAKRMRLVRKRVDVPSVNQSRIADATLGIAYIQLASFQKTTSHEVDRALWDLHRQGMRSLIVDVRGNPGGLLTAAVEVADKFVSGGTIVATRGRSPREDYDYKAHRVGTWRVPLTVLIDADSASASEIFAGAIRDHRRGTVVGQRSYGKGSVQGIFPLSRHHAGVRLTTAKFFSPSGQPISRVGVLPDVVVGIGHTTQRITDDGTTLAIEQDATLSAAMDIVRDQLSLRQ